MRGAERPRTVPTRKGMEANRVALAAERIRLDPHPDPADKAFLARNLVQVTLPHSDPGPVQVWQRTNGNLTLTVKPDWAVDPDTGEARCLGLPFGSIPRLLLFWITTETLRTQSRRLELGDSLGGFMRQLGMAPTGGRWGTIPRLKTQMERLFRARITFETTAVFGDDLGRRFVDSTVASAAELWWNHRRPDQGTLFGSWIELGEAFYASTVASPVPVDVRALHALKRSPLALDLYAWSTYRTFRVTKAGRTQFVPWRGLMKQFGGDYGDVKDFKRKAKAALRKVQAVYPGLNLEDAPGGVNVRPGLTAVPARSAFRP